jgi:hypothetical protein
MTELYNEPPPVEPTNGAGTMPLDPDQSDVSQDPTPDLDDDEVRALLATAGGVTAHQILTLAASQIGTAESPLGSNKVKYSRWYGLIGSWCFMFICWLFDQLGALALIFGKHAYVPDFKAIFSPHGEFHTSNPKPGDLVAFDFNASGEPEHIGIVEKVISGSYIQTIEGNTSDRVMRRTRYRGYVYGYATPKYGTTSQEDDMPDYVSLGQSKGQDCPAGKESNLIWDTENSDISKAHADGAYPGIFSGGKNGSRYVISVMNTDEAHVPAGYFRVIETDPKKNYAQHKHSAKLAMTPTNQVITLTGTADPGMHVYVSYCPPAKEHVDLEVHVQKWDR